MRVSCVKRSPRKVHARSELAHALDIADAAVAQDYGRGEGVARRGEVGVGLDRPRVPKEKIGLAGDGDELPFAHAAVDRDILPEVEPLRRPRRNGRALGGLARLDLLPAREALLQPLALAAHGVALAAVVHRGPRLGVDVDGRRLDTLRRSFVRVMHRALLIDPAIDFRRGRQGSEKDQAGERTYHTEYSIPLRRSKPPGWPPGSFPRSASGRR